MAIARISCELLLIFLETAHGQKLLAARGRALQSTGHTTRPATNPSSTGSSFRKLPRTPHLTQEDSIASYSPGRLQRMSRAARLAGLNAKRVTMCSPEPAATLQGVFCRRYRPEQIMRHTETEKSDNYHGNRRAHQNHTRDEGAMRAAEADVGAATLEETTWFCNKPYCEKQAYSSSGPRSQIYTPDEPPLDGKMWFGKGSENI
ncbi:hypothetical protein BU23DRAFT_567801 [Bimuria novae-zelandiae CBS 107.79]|uniref:Secreted protein n=1 Tax=Bimuria novae-zelandiae CBS 107.79 TaxID=1447943 RepID=A0A6A5VCC7_9PLEO|nr:hypothetical protein BU23DRAFT_567801 [Bimuria novae-zelandiae CBS 107.79]